MRLATLVLAFLVSAPAVHAAPPKPLVARVLSKPRGIPTRMVSNGKRLYWSEDSSEALRTPGLYTLALDADNASIEELFSGNIIEGLALAGDDVAFAMSGEHAGRVFVMPSGAAKAYDIMSGKTLDPQLDCVTALAAEGTDVYAGYMTVRCEGGLGILARSATARDASPVVMAKTCPVEIALGDGRVVWVAHNGKDASGTTLPFALMTLPREADQDVAPVELGRWKKIHDAPVVHQGRVYFVVDDDVMVVPLAGGKAEIAAASFRRRLVLLGGRLVGFGVLGGSIGELAGNVVDLGTLGVAPYTNVFSIAAGPSGSVFFGAGDMGRGGVIGVAQ